MAKEPIPFVLLDNSVLTNGVRVLVEGVDTTQFERNPVMFYRHDDWNLPIGLWANVRKENGQLLADAVFDYEDEDPQVQRIIGKVERGIVKMASAGLVDLEGTYDAAYVVPEQDGPTILTSRLREASIVAIGGNHNAFRLFDKEGKEIEFATNPQLSLSDYCKSPNFDNNMELKPFLEKLNLADTASQADVIEAINQLQVEKTNALQLADERKQQLDAMALADKAAKNAKAIELVDAAILDGRISEKPDGSVKASWLQLFDGNFDNASTLLSSMTPHKSASETLELGDTPPQQQTAWQKRQQEIADKAAAKKKGGKC